MRTKLIVCAVALILVGCEKSHTRYVITQPGGFGGPKTYTTDQYSWASGGGVRFVDNTTGRTVVLMGTMSIVEEGQP